MRIGLYLRVSTPGQATADKESLSQQQKDGISFCERQGFTFKVYNEGDASGTLTDADRETLDSLCKDIASKKLQGVWVWDEKRFSRKAWFGLQLLEILIENKARFFVGDVERDPTDSSVFTLLGINFLFAQKDLGDITKRLLMGRKASVNKGNKKLVALYGYDVAFDQNGKKYFRVNKEEAKNVIQVYDWYEKKMPIKAIFMALNDRKVKTKLAGKVVKNKITKLPQTISGFWTDKQIKNMLSQPEYAGLTYTWDKTTLIKSNLYDPIIDPDRWNRVQQTLSVTVKHNSDERKNATNHVLSSLVKCGYCMAPYYYGAVQTRNRFVYYHKTVNAEQRDCKNLYKSFRVYLEKVFEILFYTVFSNAEEINAYVQRYIKDTEDKNQGASQEKQSYNNQISKLDKEIINLTDTIATAGKTPSLLTALKKRESAKAQLQERIDEIDKGLELMKKDIKETSFKFSSEIVKQFGNADNVPKRFIYESLIGYAFLMDKELYVGFKSGKRFIIQMPRGKSNTKYVIDVYFKEAYNPEDEEWQTVLKWGFPFLKAEYLQLSLVYDYEDNSLTFDGKRFESLSPKKEVYVVNKGMVIKSLQTKMAKTKELLSDEGISNNGILR